MNKGMIHIYTGTGKGKTTAAVGLATRALGAGLKVCYTSFHKRPELFGYHEINMLQRFGAEVHCFAKGHPQLDRSIDESVIRAEVAEAMTVLREMVRNEKLDLLIMDEILISVRDNYLAEEELIRFVKEKSAHLELVLTGRGATPAMIALADYVSEINNVKHPYDMGVQSRKGIEF
jgi:cob(I)alamin adenosyltransferase